MSLYTIKVFTFLDEHFIKEWNNLWYHSENANVHNTYQRFLTCIKTYKIIDYEIYACYKKNNLVAVMPICKYRRFGVKIIGSVPNNVFYNTSFLVKDYSEELFKHFFMRIIPKSNFYITRIDNKSAEILKSIFPQALLSITAGVPYLDLNNNPLRFIPQSTLKKIKRILSKNSGKFEFKIYKDKLQEFLKIMFSIEQSSSKKLNSKDIFSNKNRREYFENLVNYCNNLVNIVFLYYQNIPSAYSFNLDYGIMLQCSQTAYLNEYKKFMPGKLLAVNLLGSLKESQIKRVDFGAGVSSFKQEFAPNYYFLYDLYFSKNIFIMFWWKSINAVRRLKKVLVPEKFTRDPEFLFKTL